MPKANPKTEPTSTARKKPVLPQSSTRQRQALDLYYTTLDDIHARGATYELATRQAFCTLLETLGRAHGWTLVMEQALPSGKRPDGTLMDSFNLPRGFWEAKDTNDDLDVEIQAKIKRGYPLTNTIFEDTRRAVLYQDGNVVFEAEMVQRAQFAELFELFFGYTEPHIDDFNAAVDKFQERIPELAGALEKTIEDERKSNQKFIAAFDVFHTLCKTAIDPNISADTIEKMLTQHLLTERLFRTIFNNPDFVARNAIAHEIENVIRALTSRSFSRAEFMKRLDHFYVAIENAANTIDDFAHKQTFLNTVYERFFQGYSRAQADTHGIVYTPQPIVDFICASVEAILQREFGKSLSDEGVILLDPCVGTGNFKVNLMRRIRRRDLPRKYARELFCNEVMLLPYYIASLNIEHAYYELTGEYAPFEGICFVDTLGLVESAQLPLFGEENTERVKREKDTPITVILGNPPYNVGQRSENEDNKNRRYLQPGGVDTRVSETYAKDSRATLKNKLYDPYIKFFRWATDRLQGHDGVVCFVSNNSFVDQVAFDGMRKHLAQDFTAIYHLDLHGNVRKNPKLSGTTHNVFGIQVGVGITVLVRNVGAFHKTPPHKTPPRATIHYHRVPENWRKEDKYAFLAEKKTIDAIEWQTLTPDAKHTWLTAGMRADFETFLPLGTKEAKSARSAEPQTIFKMYSLGVATNRDNLVYSFNRQEVERSATAFVEIYNSAADKLKRGEKTKIESLIDTDDSRIKWTRQVKDSLAKREYSEYDESHVRDSLYRPFTRKSLYFDNFWNEERYKQYLFLPTPASETENSMICVGGGAANRPFHCLITNIIPDLHLTGDTQCFPFYVYDEDGSNRRENITDYALAQFQKKHGANVTKRDIFHYVYAVLHHPQYRERYAENLKRELPRIPPTPTLALPRSQKPRTGEGTPPRPSPGEDGGSVGDGGFQTLVKIGARLAQVHLNYEQAKEYPMKWIENKDVPFSWRVEKMKLSPDKTSLIVNESLTLTGIPAECFEYRLGNRSALEWVIDQYQVSTDKRSGITTDPNREDDPEYIVRLVGRVVTVSIETVKAVRELA